LSLLHFFREKGECMNEDPAREARTKPNPDQPGRCPSIDPHGVLQCTRAIHEDDACHCGGIAWRKGSPRHVSDRERADAAEARLRKVIALIVEWEETPLPHTSDHDATRRIARLSGKREAAKALRAALAGPVPAPEQTSKRWMSGDYDGFEWTRPAGDPDAQAAHHPEDGAS